MSFEVKHKYPWKLEQYIVIAVFALLPLALFLLNANLWVVIIIGGLSLGIAVALTVVNHRRLKKSTLVAKVDDTGLLTLEGNGLEATKNRGKIKNLTGIEWDKYAYHPTLVLNFRSGGRLKLPKRIALKEPLRSHLRDNLPEHVSVTPEAKDVFDEIFNDGKATSNRKDLTAERIERQKAIVASQERAEEADKVANNGRKAGQRVQPKRTSKSKR